MLCDQRVINGNNEYDELKVLLSTTHLSIQFSTVGFRTLTWSWNQVHSFSANITYRVPVTHYQKQLCLLE